MTTQSTFWELLAENKKVEIPMLQRDYAQGRRDSRTKQIRDNFVKALCEVFNVDVQESLILDFIYGASQSGKLVLLDGQQRLTTLFLLHWYVALRSANLANAIKQLSRFKYETRTSSKDFCTALLKWDITAIPEGNSISACIEDAHWFRQAWNLDPTVKSMIVMLDSIQAALKDKTINASSWQRLTDLKQKTISFHFLNMEEFHLTDELYIKMNARGKSLSDFENFKAWLEKYVEIKGGTYPDFKGKDWKHRIDKEWTDLFWKNRGEACDVDGPFLEFFKSIGLFSFACKTPRSSDKLGAEDTDSIRRFNENEYVSVAEYDKWDCFDKDTLHRTFNLLEYFSETPDANSFLPLFTTSRKYTDRVVAYSYYLFASETSACGNSGDFAAWLRITSNLARNTAIDDPDSFVRAIQSLNRLWDRVKHEQPTGARWVLRAFASFAQTDITFFSEHQRKEEIQKAKLIMEDPGWGGLFAEVEPHPYFSGQIGFLINYSFHNSKYEPNLFKEYADKASALFKPGILNHQEQLLERALLTKGNYLIKIGANLSFCESKAGALRVLEENWRKVFRDETRSVFLKELLDDIAIASIEESLQKIIQDAQGIEEWRQLIVNCPKAISECSNRQIRFDSTEEVYLLDKIRKSGDYAELRTLYLQSVLEGELAAGKLSPFTESKYYWDKGREAAPAAHIRNAEITLRITYVRSQYHLALSGNKGAEVPPSIKARVLSDSFFVQGPGGILNKSVPKENIKETLNQTILLIRGMP